MSVSLAIDVSLTKAFSKSKTLLLELASPGHVKNPKYLHFVACLLKLAVVTKKQRGLEKMASVLGVFDTIWGPVILIWLFAGLCVYGGGRRRRRRRGGGDVGGDAGGDGGGGGGGGGGGCGGD